MDMMSHIKVRSTTTYHTVLSEFRELPIEIYALKLTVGFQRRHAHLSPSWVLSITTSLSQHLAEQGLNT